MRTAFQITLIFFIITNHTFSQDTLLLNKKEINFYNTVDTLYIKQKVEALQTQKDKVEFWKEMRSKDQSLRGPRADKMNDLKNLIAASYYLNTFGYPEKEEYGYESAIISIIWIHNSYPEVTRLTFPIILQGLQSKQIDEKDLRLYYLRSNYNRKYNDELYRTKKLSTIFKELDLTITPKININEILTAYLEAEEFLNQDFKIIGHWDNPNSHEEIKILLTEENEYYLHKIFQDGSHYPQIIFQDSSFKNLFRIHADSEFYFGIQENGDLSVKYSHGVRKIKSISDAK